MFKVYKAYTGVAFSDMLEHAADKFSITFTLELKILETEHYWGFKVKTWI